MAIKTMEIDGPGEVASGVNGDEALKAFPSEIEQRESSRRPCPCGAEKGRHRPICDDCLCDPARIEAAMQGFLPEPTGTRSGAEFQAAQAFLRRSQLQGETVTSWLVEGIVGSVVVVGLVGAAVWLFWRLLRAVLGV